MLKLDPILEEYFSIHSATMPDPEFVEINRKLYSQDILYKLRIVLNTSPVILNHNNEVEILRKRIFHWLLDTDWIFVELHNYKCPIVQRMWMHDMAIFMLLNDDADGINLESKMEYGLQTISRMKAFKSGSISAEDYLEGVQ